MKRQNKARVDDKNVGNIRDMFGIPLFGRDIGVLLRSLSIYKGNRPIWVATVNPEFVMNALKDRHFLEILQIRTTYNVVDGIGLVWAEETKLRITNYELRIKSKTNVLHKLYFGFFVGVEILQGKHRESLITGADLMDKLCSMAQKNNQSVYFFGGWDDRAERTAKYFLKKYPKLKVVGYRAEDYDFKTKTDYLFVARAMKKQEEWIDENFEKLNVGVVMGVGRSFDYYSGELSRAPAWLQRMGLEWLFSLVVQPERWKRQLELPKYVWKVLIN